MSEWKKLLDDVRRGASLLDEEAVELKPLPANLEFEAVEADVSATGYLELLVFAGQERLAWAFLDPFAESPLWLDLILVTSPYRERGLGARLLGEVERIAKSRAFDHLHGEVTINEYTPTADRRDARAQWFKKQGFQVAQRPSGDWDIEKSLK